MRVRKFAAVGAALALSLAGIVAVAAPANAAQLTATVTTPGMFVASTATPQFTADVTLSGAFTGLYMQVPGGMSSWTFNPTTCGTSSSSTSSLAACGISSATVSGNTVSSAAYKSGNSIYLVIPSSTAAGPLSITFAAGTFTTATAGSIQMGMYTSAGMTVDQIAIPITVGAASQTVTFNSNFGTPTTSTQTANVPTNLTANSFTRSGYTFRNWNTAANGSGTTYADGAQYAFGSAVTLYAQWAIAPSPSPTSTSSASSTSSTATVDSLASTGANAALPIGAAASLLVVGAAIALIRRRTAQ